MKAKDVMRKYNICRYTLYRWVKAGRIEYSKTPSGRYIYGLCGDYENPSEDVTIQKTAIYARVSTTGQKDNLTRQISRLKSFASAKGLVVDEIYSETASALNYKRPKYNKLLNDIFDRKVKNLIIEYKDRVVRIGFDEFELICQKFGVNLIVVDLDENGINDKHKEITNDLISIIHHFSSKIYSLRKNKKQIEELIQC